MFYRMESTQCLLVDSSTLTEVVRDINYCAGNIASVEWLRSLDENLTTIVSNDRHIYSTINFRSHLGILVYVVFEVIVLCKHWLGNDVIKMDRDCWEQRCFGGLGYPC